MDGWVSVCVLAISVPAGMGTCVSWGADSQKVMSALAGTGSFRLMPSISMNLT